MTDHERAVAIAKVQAKQRADAQHILEADGHLKLEQSTAARHLNVALKEVEDSSGNIGDIESEGEHATLADRTLSRVRSMILEADRKMAEGGFSTDEDFAEEAAPPPEAATTAAPEVV